MSTDNRQYKVNIFRNKVSLDFIIGVESLSHALAIEPDWLMTVIAFETAYTFSPSIRNVAGSGAVGLIQFMPKTAKELGTSVEALSKMSAVDQLIYVHKYLHPYKNRIQSVCDLYMAILWPAAIGKPLDYVVFAKGRISYLQNSGLDLDKDGLITKGEICKKIMDILQKERTKVKYKV